MRRSADVSEAPESRTSKGTLGLTRFDRHIHYAAALVLASSLARLRW